jgi:hypothetical protein
MHESREVTMKIPNSLSQAEYARLSEKEKKETIWRTMTRNPHVYVRGTVRHSDRKTYLLVRLAYDTETQAAAMRVVAFLD